MGQRSEAEQDGNGHSAGHLNASLLSFGVQAVGSCQPQRTWSSPRCLFRYVAQGTWPALLKEPLPLPTGMWGPLRLWTALIMLAAQCNPSHPLDGCTDIGWGVRGRWSSRNVPGAWKIPTRADSEHETGDENE
ncbi:hypothetical protein ACLOJK_039366 [Asimina triloba]